MTISSNITLCDKLYDSWRGRLPTLGNNAFHTDQASKVAGSEGPGADVVGPEAALETNVEVLKLFGKGGINGGHQIFQGLLERDQFTERILQHTAKGEYKQEIQKHISAITISNYFILTYYSWILVLLCCVQTAGSK